jgi:hypothetical protein
MRAQQEFYSAVKDWVGNSDDGDSFTLLDTQTPE